jgi:dTDP-L-rhamnose 4-epimerase
MVSRTILVTGGAGFVGSHVVDQLVALGHAVRVLDCLHPAAHREAPGYQNPSAEYVWGDLRDLSTVARCVEGIDAVCHQASMVGLGIDFRDVTEYVAHNDLGTAVLLQALERSRFRGRLVLAGSMVVYGEGAYTCPTHGDIRPAPRARARLDDGVFDPACPLCSAILRPQAVKEDAATDPRSIYAATKLHQENLCNVFAREHGLPCATLRYHNVYGPRMPRDTPYAGVASIFRSALENGRVPEVFEDGRQIRDFVHVRDVARANVLALRAAAPVEGAFNIASGTPRTIMDLADGLCDALGPGATRPRVTGAYRLGDVRHVFASPERAADELGYRASISLSEGIREFATAELRATAGAIRGHEPAQSESSIP